MDSLEDGRPGVWILPPLPFAVAILGGWWIDRNVLPLTLDAGQIGIVLALALIAAGLALFLWTAITLHRHRTTINPYKGATALCTDGPFRISRNPIYLGDWLLLLGLSLLLRTCWPLTLAPAVWAILRFGVIRQEERHLEERFGESYRLYRGRVGRWLWFS